jgi:hypothetical protein
MDATAIRFAAPGDLLAHAGFPAAREAYLEAIIAIYDGRTSQIELMADSGRILLYGVVMALWGAYRDDVPATHPTIGRIKDTLARFTLSSPRQIDTIIARFVQAGHLVIEPASHDRRLRIVLPTPSLVRHEAGFLQAHYTPLGIMFGNRQYERALSGETGFLKAVRGCWLSSLEPLAKDVILANRPILKFYNASAGMLLLFELARLQGAADGQACEIDHTDLGRRFGVSRTHVRTLLRAAAADGDVAIVGRGRLRLSDRLCAALDRNIAHRLSLLDRSYAMASRGVDGQPPVAPARQAPAAAAMAPSR